MQTHLSKRERKNVIDLLSSIDEHRVPHKSFSATWSSGFGTLSIDREGRRIVRSIAEILKSVEAWQTYPSEYLERQTAFKYLEHYGDAGDIVESLQKALAEGYGQQDAFVPFWSFHLEESVTLDFGAYRLSKLGESGFQNKILRPFETFRSAVGAEAFAADLEHVRESFAHIPNVPTLHIRYMGAAKGAKDFVDPIALRVAEFVQFLLAKKCPDRSDVRIIDHKGAYFGRFATVMPVLSWDENLEPVALDSPNLRGFPYGVELDGEDISEFERDGVLSLLPYVAAGPTKGRSASSMLLRAIQLFSDGERAVSVRQAMISYVGACDTLFGKQLESELYTCAGMAAACGASFDECTALYAARSEAAHAGIMPVGLKQARDFAWKSILYVARNQATLLNKKAIRAWIEPHVNRLRRS